MSTANTVALDLAPLMSWIVAGMTIINFGILMQGLLSSGEKKLELRLTNTEAEIEGRLDKLEETAKKHDRRIQTVEAEIKHLPTKESVHQLQVDLTDMKGQMMSMAKTSEATERATRRVEEFLLRERN